MNEKLVALLGPAAGLAVGGLSAGIGACAAKKFSLFDKGDFITCSGNSLKNARGEDITLLIFSFPDMITNLDERRPYSRRFGAYGEACLVNARTSSYIAPKDVDAFSKDGCSALRISFGYQFIYPSGSINGKPKFCELEKLLDACRARGMYAILNLCDATELKAKKEKNAEQMVRLWGEIAGHFANDSSVAAYDLKSSVDAGNIDFIPQAVSAIRKKGDSHAVILTDGTKVNDGNIIYKSTRNCEPCGAPVIHLETSTDFRKVNATLEKGISVELSAVKTLLSRGVYTAKTPFEYSDETEYNDLLEKIKDTYSTEKNFDRAGGVLPCGNTPTGKPKDCAKGNFIFRAGLRTGKNLFGIVRKVNEYD